MSKHVVMLKLSAELELPLDAITERLGWLGTSGSGKTYGAGKLAEEMLDVGAQVIVLDPVGPWWGLRSSADGKRAGLVITVFGGMHGDLPLTPESGSLIAERSSTALMPRSTSTSERFFERKKGNPSPVHLFLEEAHTFLPQQLPPDPHAAVMMNRVERIVRVGRNYGIGSSQISQMPQAITKKTLNVVACLFAFAAIGKHERKAIGVGASTTRASPAAVSPVRSPTVSIRPSVRSLPIELRNPPPSAYPEITGCAPAEPAHAHAADGVSERRSRCCSTSTQRRCRGRTCRSGRATPSSLALTPPPGPSSTSMSVRNRPMATWFKENQP